MPISARDKEFRLPKVSYLDYKQITIDRTLLNLFPRLKFNGYPGRVLSSAMHITVQDFVDEFSDEKNRARFRGFTEHKDIVTKWLESDLLDLVNRGKPNQAVVAPRPLHGNTYKFRNSKHAKDYGTSEQVYWMLYHARGGKGQAAIDALKRFFMAGLDPLTDKIQMASNIDVETQAILNLDQQVKKDLRDESKKPEIYPPICIRHADLLADDILRLMAYHELIPRSVLVDYIKILLSFHLALYHLAVFKLLPILIRERGQIRCGLEPCPVTAKSNSNNESCPSHVGLLVDMGDVKNRHMSELARRSADAHYRRIPEYIQAQFAIKKLDEMASYLIKLGRIVLPARGYFSIGDLLQFLTPEYNNELDKYFGARMAGLIEAITEGADGANDPLVGRIADMGLDDFEGFIEMLTTLRSPVHRRNLVTCIDSLLSKNPDTGLLQQSRAKGSSRRFVLGSKLLEVLLQVAVVVPQGASFATRELRVDELLQILRERYGIHVDRLPQGDGFGIASILDQQALRKNAQAFKMRLREIGFFQDLSDAYITQTIVPRYTIAQGSY